jgi:hypothetical protein
MTDLLRNLKWAMFIYLVKQTWDADAKREINEMRILNSNEIW